MANDRVHIRCDGCGAWKMLMKFNAAGLHTADNGILEWLDAHGACHPKASGVDLGGVPGFSLYTDDDAFGEALAIGLQNAAPPDGVES